jgi:toxin ParE1/3/4
MTQPRFTLSDPARQDLDDIWDYIAEDNPEAADRWIDQLAERFLLLGEHPRVGRLRPELAEHLRSFPVGRYIIFYRARTDSVDIVRVLHGSRDLPAVFGMPGEAKP